MADSPTKPKTWFGPVVLVGLLSAGLTSLAASKTWFTAAIDLKAYPGARELDTQADMPAALALSLVVLASWGVVLVARTIGRRIALTLAALASCGVIATVVVAAATLPGQIRDQLGVDGDSVSVGSTLWYVVAAVGSVVCLVAVLAGWVLAPRWPTMSSRYDAPAGAPAAPRDETDLWKALDAGVDPTATEGRDAP